MAKHTPGPWKFSEGDPAKKMSTLVWAGPGDKFDWNGNRQTQIGWVLCEWSNEQQRAEDLANARLIAAAPELLEIVRHVHLFLREGGTLNAYALFDARTIYQAADEVIRKAEGPNG